MIVGPKVVAVDDNVEHLTILEQGFEQLGGFCVGLEYTLALSRAGPLPTGVRILFMDINLMPGGAANEGARTFQPIVTIIRKLIKPENGPYALVTWTDSPQSHDNLIAFLAEHLDPPLLPCADFSLSKAEYLEDAPALAERLRNLGNELPGLAMLLDWEGAVIRAADRAVFEMISLSDEQGKAAGASVVQSVHAVGSAAHGKSSAAKAPFRAFTAGMTGVLSDRIDNAAPNEETEKTWAALIAAAHPAEPDLKQQARLNSYFHLASIDGGVPASPGIIYSLTSAEIQRFVIPHLGASLADALASGEFVPLKGNAFADISKEAFAGACRWRLVRLGAECDYANEKLRVFEGHIALEIPEAMFGITKLQDGSRFRDTPAKSEWLFQAPPLWRNNERFALVINLRMPFSAPLRSMARRKPLYRLRESLTAEVAAYSKAFATRPGLVEFR